MFGLLTRPMDVIAPTMCVAPSRSFAIQYGENHLKPLPGSRSHSTKRFRPPPAPPAFFAAKSSLTSPIFVTQPSAPLSGYFAASSGTSGCPWYTGMPGSPLATRAFSSFAIFSPCARSSRWRVEAS